jgi:hypothetical protein
LVSKRTLSLLAFLPFLAFGSAFPVAFGGQPGMDDGQEIAVKAMQIPEFKRGAGTVYGKLEYLGGLVLATKNGEMGAVSSIRFLDQGTTFISVMDTGHWATGAVERDEAGTLKGIRNYKIWAMDGSGKNGGDHKESLDAEGMALGPGHVYVGFERHHRIATYSLPGFETTMPIAVQPPVITPGQPLRNNGGMEAVLKASDAGALRGALFFVAERSYDKAGNFVAGVQSGPLKGSFSVERLAPYDVTDGVVLEDGSFLLLERKFGLKDGIGMRIRKFSTADIAPGATVKGETLMEADFTHQIDNMEGLDAFTAADGLTHLVVISDDNHSLLERNLMLEFKMLP